MIIPIKKIILEMGNEFSRSGNITNKIRNMFPKPKLTKEIENTKDPYVGIEGLKNLLSVDTRQKRKRR